MGLAGIFKVLLQDLTETYGDQGYEFKSYDYFSSAQCFGVGLGAASKSLCVPQMP